jgi:hypothetical protein
MIAQTEARVLVESTPPGATIYVDGKEAGVAPIEVEIRPDTLIIGAALGELSGAYSLHNNGGAKEKINIILVAPAPREVGSRFRPSWPAAALGASLTGAGAFLHFHEDVRTADFVSLGLMVGGSFLTALAIGIGDEW